MLTLTVGTHTLMTGVTGDREDHHEASGLTLLHSCYVAAGFPCWGRSCKNTQPGKAKNLQRALVGCFFFSLFLLKLQKENTGKNILLTKISFMFFAVKATCKILHYLKGNGTVLFLFKSGAVN